MSMIVGHEGRRIGHRRHRTAAAADVEANRLGPPLHLLNRLPHPAGAGLRAWLSSMSGVVAIGALDYFSGTELRTFPLYYFPISLAAWCGGHTGAALISLLSAASWVISNYLAGLSYSNPAYWAANFLVQGASFALVGALIATIRGALMRERALSRVDALTSLSNTRAFYEDAALAIKACRAGGHPVTVAYIDLDNFKAVNDRHGHQAGDLVLQRVAHRLRDAIQPRDMCARLGGDEFIALFPRLGSAEAAAAAERLRASLAQVAAPAGCCVGATIGVVTFASPPGSLEEMIHEADARMYAAKNARRSRVSVSATAGSEKVDVCRAAASAFLHARHLVTRRDRMISRS